MLGIGGHVDHTNLGAWNSWPGTKLLSSLLVLLVISLTIVIIANAGLTTAPVKPVWQM